MRYLLFPVLFFTMAFGISAQDDVLMPDNLPEPIFHVAPDEVYWMNPNQFAWLDNQTLIFEYSGTGYQYDLDASSLTELSSSPFEADMSEEARERFRVGENATVHQSPYTMPDDQHNILYFSEIGILCNPGCDSSIIFRGTYGIDDTGIFSGTFTHTDFNVYGLSNIMWSSDHSGAIIERGSIYGGGTGLYYWDLESHDELQMPVYLLDTAIDKTLAISMDGNRLAISTSMNFDMEDEPGQKLVIWDSPYHDDHCTCTYDGQTHVIAPAPMTDNQGNYFAGVSFVDEDTILYIGDMGLMRHNLLTGISTIIDPELNVGWIRTAVFSPDNQHVAITTQQGLFILPLDLD